MFSRILLLAGILYTLFSSSEASCTKATKGRIYRPDNCTSSILDRNIQDALSSPITVSIIPTFYLVVFLIGLPANGIAFWVLLSKAKKMPSTLLLINLAAADLLFMLALPFKIAYHFLGNNWIFGENMCRAVTAVFYGNMYCSVFFLTAISIDRHIALVHPFQARSLRSWRSFLVVSVGIWLVVIGGVSIFLIVPQTKTFKEPDITTCHEVLAVCCDYTWYTKYFIGLFIAGFAIPLVVILLSYIPILVTLAKNKESHSQVIRLLILVVIIFIICFTPSNVLLVLHYLETTWESHNNLYFWYTLALSFTSFNSCIDPFIYYYMSEDFRTMVRKTLQWNSNGNSESVECTKRTKLSSEMARISA
ncbi:proteinase-activated receptor 3-like [Hyperolius riggenbachi]|uniref:proteinase-activated receptor 3-like n=1 Tax=Hyperolius riggenbachi TaxID=752182 RepID=UPI0035A334AB